MKPVLVVIFSLILAAAESKGTVERPLFGMSVKMKRSMDRGVARERCESLHQPIGGVEKSMLFGKTHGASPGKIVAVRNTKLLGPGTDQSRVRGVHHQSPVRRATRRSDLLRSTGRARGNS
ncbi:predicted protein [Phaeodactylum tricornutum CCAP 1055/1]|jgi:hypothetical protein|uniref:Uncharacterized protein n=2 Tax=Phaeodactylum tricornutum TaxID=2850 RepID=B7G877_PHATC|nr:predicted protein [Phaeodactylum tricornutum CCAP 1055/1]EEC44994.1 predicted protein [Phaeodactylum tricornutum CCAP 1055/1]|eukprot:XP_002183294.1 predicted protein [Phaeodactylum tricornutum CCAP 1055/1]